MALSERRITVVVDGTSKELQKSITTAVDSLKRLGTVTAQQSKIAVDWGDRVIKKNNEVAQSYVRLVDAASKTATSVARAAERQSMAVRDNAGVVVTSTRAEQDAFRGLAATANRAALDISSAAQREATAVKGAAAEQTAAQHRAGRATTENAARQNAAFASSGSALVRFGKTVAVTSAAVALGSVYMAGKFEAASERLLTQAGATQRQVGDMRKSILDMSGALGQTPQHLTEGLYHIVSSMNAVLPPATRTREELQIMAVAAHAAAVGGTSMQETSYALASAMNALHVNASGANTTMAQLNAIVGTGDMTMNDLLASLKSGLIPTAAGFKISLQSLGAALALMGDQGMRGALAGTRLRMSLALMAAPTKQSTHLLEALGMGAGEVKTRTAAMSEALTKAGLTTTTMASDLTKPNGIAVALKDLRDHLLKAGLAAPEATALISRAFGGGRMGSTIQLLYQSVDRLGVKYQQQGVQINKWGEDVSKTQGTLAFQAKQAEGALAALGVKIGQDLTPVTKSLLSDLKETAHWFEHNKGAAEALAFTVTGVLGVAVAAFIANRLAKMVEGLKQIGAMQQWMRSGFGATPATRTAVAASAPGVPGAIGGTGLVKPLIYGARGAILPGSITNPIAVAIEAGQFAGLGGRAAAIGASGAMGGEMAAARAESQSAGGVLLPPGVKSVDRAATRDMAASGMPAVVGQEVKASEEQATRGLGASLRTGLGGLMANAMKGGMIALAGTLAAQMAGSAVGGAKGQAVAKIGTDTALGAAIGTAMAPGIGTAIGAALGGAGGLISQLAHDKHIPTVGTPEELPRGQHDHAADVAAEHAGKGMAQSTQTALAKGLHEALAEGNRVTEDLEKRGRSRTVAGRAGNEAVKAREEAVGRPFGQAVVAEQLKVTAGLSPAEKITSIVNAARMRLKGLPVAAQQTASEAMIELVHGMESHKELPLHSVKSLVHQLGDAFPPLKGTILASASNSMAGLAAQLKGEQVLREAAGFIDNLRNVYVNQGFPKIVSLAGAQGIAQMRLTQQKLFEISKTGSYQERLAAEAEGKKLKHFRVANFQDTYSSLAAQLKDWNSREGKLTAEGAAHVKNLYGAQRENIERAVSEGLVKAEDGTHKINKLFVEELQALGVKVPGNASASSIQSALNSAQQGGNVGFNKQGGAVEYPHKARGGLVQLGRPGERGRDSIPLHVNGMGIVAAPGEQVAVFNHEQQAVANAKMADIGGLPGLFSKHKKPHHMAAGGFVPRQAYPGPMGRIDQGVDFAGPGPVRAVLDGSVLKTGLWPGWPGTGGIVYRTARGNVYVMENFAPSVRGGPVKAGQVIGTDTGGRYGIETGWANAAGTGPLTPYNGAADGTAMPGGKSFASFLGGGPGGGVTGGGAAAAALAAAVWKRIKSPRLGGRGVMAAIAQKVADHVTAAANKRGEAIAGASGGGGAIGSMVGNAMQLAKAAALAEHVPWDEGIVRTLLSKESAGGQNLPPHQYGGGLDPAGPMQIISSTFGAYAVPGHGNRMAPWDNFLAGFNYIHHRYGTLQNLAATTGLMGGGYKGYEEGGPVAFAGGGPLGKAAATKGKVSASKAPAKAKLTKPPTHKPSLKAQVQGSLSRKLGPLSIISGANTIPELIAPYEKTLGAMGNLMGLLKSVEGDKDGTVLIDSDMKYLSGLASHGVHAGMTTTEAYERYEQLLASAGESPDLTFEGQIVKWAEGQADHRLLTTNQAGILKAAARDAMASNDVQPGRPLLAIEEGVVSKEITELFSEKQGASKVVSRIKFLIAERRKRAAHMVHLMKVAAKRADNIREDLARLGSSNRAAKLHAAQHAYYQNQRVYDATEHKEAIAQNIAATEAIPSKDRSSTDKANLAKWKTEEAGLKGFIHSIHVPSTGALTAAHYAVLKGKLQGELTPLSTSLSLLGGSSTHVGHGGMYGEMEKDIKTFMPAQEAAEGELATITDSKIPTAYFNLEDIARSMVESEIPRKIASKAGGPEENAALVALQKQQLAILAQNLATAESQFAVFSGFTAHVPHFAKGGPVVDDGLIYAHRGEHVVPRDGTLVSHGGRPQVHLTNEINVHGEIGPLIGLIDSRIAHPDNVRAVSAHMARRTQNFPGFAR